MGRKTFAKAREELFDHLRREGWTVHLRDARTFKPLKIPYAIDPRGEHRLYFKTEAVYIGHAGPGASIQQARSIHVDIRDVSPSEFVEYARRWMQPNGLKANALLAKPPRSWHTGNIAARPAMYEGVHTTGSTAIAAAYAMSAWQKMGGADSGAYPVYLVLDVSGLEPVADVDAMETGRDAMAGIQMEIRDILREGGSASDIVDRVYWLGEDHGGESNAEPGDEPAAFIFANIPRDPFTSLIEALKRHGLEDSQIVAVLHKFAKNGVDALPDIVLSEVVDQQRYLTDIGLDRVVQVVAFKPWWPEVLDVFWSGDDDPREIAAAESIEAGGWKLWTLEEAYESIEPIPRKVIAQPLPEDQLAMSFRGDPVVEYHGTVSTVVEEAFPGLIPLEPPFPVDPEG